MVLRANPAVLTVLFSFLSVLAVSKDAVERGFERLAVHDYFQARELFVKAIEKDPLPAYYGLSIVTSRNNNPFYNLDSARIFILKADSIFAVLLPKEELSMRKKYNIGRSDIVERKDTIAGLAYRAAVTDNV